MVAASWGFVGVSASTSTAACIVLISYVFLIISCILWRSPHRLPVEWSDQGVAIAILCGGDGGFGFDDRVDTADWELLVCEAGEESDAVVIPRLATSVAISKRKWLRTSLLVVAIVGFVID